MNPGVDENDVRFCWEQILRVNPMFRVTWPFAPRSQKDGLLALYALFSAVEQICSAVADEDVARRKLDWWRLETLHKDAAESAHPVMKLFHAQDTAQALRKSALARLFDRAEQRLDAPAPANAEQLKALCCDLYVPQVELELGLAAGDAAKLVAPETGARGGLLQLMRESLVKRSGAFWWVPLPLLARYGVNRAQLTDPGERSAARPVFAEILDGASAWGSSQRLDSNAVTGVDAGAMRHVFVSHAMHAKKVNRLARISPDAWAKELAQARPGELFSAWRAARQCTRSA